MNAPVIPVPIDPNRMHRLKFGNAVLVRRDVPVPVTVPVAVPELAADRPSYEQLLASHREAVQILRSINRAFGRPIDTSAFEAVIAAAEREDSSCL